MIRKDIEELIRPVLTDLGITLWGAEYFPQGAHSILRVYIDKENGVTLDDCAFASKQINSILDVEEVLKGRYFLEVSSPGISRPLFTLNHYELYKGKEIEVKLNTAINNRRKLRGIIISINGETIQLSAEKELFDIPLAHIAKANLIGE